MDLRSGVASPAGSSTCRCSFSCATCSGGRREAGSVGMGVGAAIADAASREPPAAWEGGRKCGDGGGGSTRRCSFSRATCSGGGREVGSVASPTGGSTCRCSFLRATCTGGGGYTGARTEGEAVAASSQRGGEGEARLCEEAETASRTGQTVAPCVEGTGLAEHGWWKDFGSRRIRPQI